MLLEKRRTLPQRILRQIRIETYQSQHRVIDQSERRVTDQSGDWNKARCKRVVVVAVGNCTRATCVRARRCQRSSTESARSPPQLLYIPGQFVRWSRRIISVLWFRLTLELTLDAWSQCPDSEALTSCVVLMKSSSCFCQSVLCRFRYITTHTAGDFPFLLKL